jgi:hypothetical protein
MNYTCSLRMTAFWDIALCSLIEVDWHFRGVYCLHHQGDQWKQCAPLKCRSTLRLHGAMAYKAVVFILAAMGTWNLTPVVLSVQPSHIFVLPNYLFTFQILRKLCIFLVGCQMIWSILVLHSLFFHKFLVTRDLQLAVILLFLTFLCGWGLGMLIRVITGNSNFQETLPKPIIFICM